MGKIKQHYYEILSAQSADDECYCTGTITSIEEVCPSCKTEYELTQEQNLPEDVINIMANDLNQLEGEEFWDKMNDIEEYFEDNYLEAA